jgi:S1-C subfamily serine protease
MRRIVVLCMLSALLGCLVAFELHGLRLSDSQTLAQDTTTWPAQAQPGAPTDALTAEERVNVFVYQQVNRGVVNIDTKGVTGDRFLMFEVVASGEGSGSVIDRQGHILTNFHVIKGAREIQVTLFDGNTYSAKLVGGDPSADVAVIKIDAPAESLFPVTFGSSSNLLVGQRVFAIGNPFGFERTLSTGVVSSLDRPLPSPDKQHTMKSIIQIDAAINPGMSGGPLLDTHARMIGMNTAIASKTGQSVGIGFAIPVNTIARIVPQLIQKGHVERADIGITKVYLTDRGLFVAVLVPNGPAQRAGLQGPRIEKKQQRQGPFITESQTVNWSAADMIAAIDGQPIKTVDDFLSAVEAKQPGQQIVITVIRAGQQVDVPLTLGSGG